MNEEKRRIRIAALIAVCVAAIAACTVYLIWIGQRDAVIARNNQRYRAIHIAAQSASPTEAPSETPVPTPDADTVRIALPTPPPVSEDALPLLGVNPDYCGWLTAGADIDLPVVHRENDNTTYLTRDFDGAPSDGGSLFMDGFNRLYPVDTLTIIYGHNMKSGEMFGGLSRFADAQYLLANPLVTFETIYGEKQYVPFAAFRARIDQVDIRQLQPSPEDFNALADQFRRLSCFDDGIEARFGDELLALVTCSGSDRDERFFLICRALRRDETPLGVTMAIEAALEKRP